MHSIVWFFTTGRFDSGWVQAVASVALVILTLITLAVLVRYAWDTRTLAIASNKSADAAVAGSEASIAQIRAMIDKERARIFVVPSTEISIQCAVSYLTQMTHNFLFFNVGPTPAINVTVRYNAIATQLETEPREKPAFPAPIQEVIAANDKDSAPLLIRSVAFEEDGKASPVFYIHFWGEVTYNDVISSEQRSTKFRYRATMTLGMHGSVAMHDGEWPKFGVPGDNQAT